MEFEFSSARCILIVMVCVLSLFGAHARYVFDHGKLDWRPLLGEYVVGLFTGLCVFYLVSETDKIGKELKYFCVIMSGFCARDIVKFISYSFVERFRRFMENTNGPINATPVSEEKKPEPEKEEKK